MEELLIKVARQKSGDPGHEKWEADQIASQLRRFQEDYWRFLAKGTGAGKSINLITSLEL